MYVNVPFVFLGTPMLTLRGKLPLKPIIPYSEAENPEFKVPQFTHTPKTVGYFESHRHGTNIPGMMNILNLIIYHLFLRLIHC